MDNPFRRTGPEAEAVEQQAIREFLGDQPEAEEWRTWRSMLERRIAGLRREYERTEDPQLLIRIEELGRSVRVLAKEEAITEFVEDSVRVTLAMGAVVDGGDEFEE